MKKILNWKENKSWLVLFLYSGIPSIFSKSSTKVRHKGNMPQSHSAIVFRQCANAWDSILPISFTFKILAWQSRFYVNGFFFISEFGQSFPEVGSIYLDLMLTLSWQRLLSYRNQSIDFLCIKAFIKPFQTQQRSVKIKIWVIFSLFVRDFDRKG